ncbi:MAG: DUF3990 domain-containing protein [Alphaproteobacteria bacterium]|nr:MAG: DUF3990 domain-containing protein [Alphaproteobacteria bacterium]
MSAHSWSFPTLYHGTIDSAAKALGENREDVRLLEDRHLDFGPGFYMTTSLEQAKKWAEKQARREGRLAGSKPPKGAVISLNTNLQNILSFKNWGFGMAFGGIPGQDWNGYFSLVKLYRSLSFGDARKFTQYIGWDVLIGPVAKLGSEIKEIKPSLDQVAFVSDRAIQWLTGKFRLVGYYDVEIFERSVFDRSRSRRRAACD